MYTRCLHKDFLKLNLPYISPHIKRSHYLLEEADGALVRVKVVAKSRFGSGFPETKSRVVSFLVFNHFGILNYK